MGKQRTVTIASCALVKVYASTVVNAVGARIVGGVNYASTVVYAVGARIVEGHQYASTVVDAISARIVGLWARAQQIKNSEGLRRLKWK